MSAERIDCRWCGLKQREASQWEQEKHLEGWFPLCRNCANHRLRNPFNALLPMRQRASSRGVV